MIYEPFFKEDEPIQQISNEHFFQDVQHTTPQYEQTNEQLLKQYTIDSSMKYRAFMKQHGKEISKLEHMNAIRASGTNPHIQLDGLRIQTKGAYLFKSSFDPVRPIPDTDTKKTYIEKQQRSLRMVSPQISKTLF